MKKFLIAAALSAVAIAPAVASAQDPNPADFKNAAKYCKEFRTASGANFATMFGTKKNAYGKCVSQTAKKTATEDAAQEKAAKSNAAKECKAEGLKGREYGKCVSTKAKEKKAAMDAEDAEEAGERKRAARECANERGDIGREAFADRYETSESKKNAFGKCVSRTARES